MSALEKLKEKLRAKPNVEELGLKQVNVVIPIPNRPEELTTKEKPRILT